MCPLRGSSLRRGLCVPCVRLSGSASVSFSSDAPLQGSSPIAGSYFDRVNKANLLTKSADGKTGKFCVYIPDTFSISHAPNGGYVAAAAVDAGRQMTSFPEPLTLSCHFVNKFVENCDAIVDVSVLQISKSTSTMEMSIFQESKLRAKFLSAFGDIANMKGINHNKKLAPELPPREDCVRFNRSVFPFEVSNLDRIDIWLPNDEPFLAFAMKGKEGSEATIQGWGKFSDPEATICPRSLAYFLDAFPPPVLNLKQSTWVPTLEYTVHFWNTSALKENPKQCLRLKYRTPYVQNSLMFTNAEAWTEDGTTLLATGRQLARVL
jgi:hypothetical protein